MNNIHFVYQISVFKWLHNGSLVGNTLIHIEADTKKSLKSDYIKELKKQL